MYALRVSWWHLLMTLMLVVMGFIVAAQVRATRLLASQQVPTRSIYAMATLLREERLARQSLETQVTQLRRQIEAYEGTASQGRSAVEAMTKELETLRIAVGQKRMRGSGVVVRLEDPKVQGRGHPPVMVSYQDVVAVVNELWAAGAEAVAINDQRVTATTGVSQVSGSIVVNLQRLSQPFEISAIGDPATLDNALNIRGGLIEGLRALGLELTVTRRITLLIPASKAPITFEYAHPVP